MLDFLVEWHDAPGVKDEVLAKTWARLEIQVRDAGSQPRCLTRCVRSQANSVQRGVYGSVFPLAEWVVENWWFLLFEPVRVARYSGGRHGVRVAGQRQWTQRHNLLAAREGGSLPDLTFFRDDLDVVACWFPDPEEEELIRPTRFISGAGSVRLEPLALEAALHQFVEAVLERLGSADDEDASRLRDNWRAVCDSRMSEADLCARAASLGVDPYDPEVLDEHLIDLLDSDVAGLPDHLRGDLLEASDGHSLEDDLLWVKTGLERLNTRGTELEDVHRAGLAQRLSATAHEFGYRSAREFRARLGIPAEPIPDLADLLHRKRGWPADPRIILEGSAAPNLTALIGTDLLGCPRIVERPGKSESQQYRLARGLYFVPIDEHIIAPRLITAGHTWDQRASRAFAAELLAPQDLLRDRVNERSTYESIEELAREFNISSRVILHQLGNHGIAWADASEPFVSWFDAPAFCQAMGPFTSLPSSSSNT